MPNGQTSFIDRVIQEHGLDAYRNFRSSFPYYGYHAATPAFPHNAIVPCRDCSNELHHQRMNFMNFYELHYVHANYQPNRYGEQPLLHAERERRMVSLCPSCLDECTWCGDQARMSLQEYSSVVLCEGCQSDAVLCSSCDEVMHCDNANYFTNSDYDAYCRSCFRSNVVTCDECDSTWHQDGDPACECATQSDLVNSYSYKPSAIFRDVNSYEFTRNDDDHAHTPFMGFELEVEAGRNDRHSGAQLFETQIMNDNLYLKEDGSLDNGFEIVTHPSTIEYYQSEFDWSSFDELRALKFKSWSTRTCGFHVHISRDAFYTKQMHKKTNSSPHLMGFLLFIYKNASEVEAISGRNSSYGRISDSELENVYEYSRFRGHSERYVAVNTLNAKTIELRCFKGSINKNRILGYLEFVEAVYQYTKTNRITKLKDSMDFLAFTQWCEVQPKYDNLLNIIRRSGALDIE